MSALRDGDSLPETFLDLDEVAAPSPVQDDEGPSLETTRSRARNDSPTISPLNQADHSTSESRDQSNLLSEVRSNYGETAYRSGTSSRLSYSGPDYQSNEKPLQANLRDRTQRPAFQGQPQGYHGHLTELSAPAPVNPPYNAREHDSDEQPFEKSSEPTEALIKATTVCYLIFFSIWGTLARLGLQALTVYPGAPVTQGVLWANVGGSLIMGFLSEDKRLFAEPLMASPGLTRIPVAERNKKHAAIKKSIPLYIGLSGGFCGCFTSFSSWQRDSFLAMSNTASTSPLPRNGGYSFLALLATLILTPTLCLAALQVGAHIALALDPMTPKLSFKWISKIVNPSIIPIALLSWLAAIFLAIWPPDRPSGPAGHTSWAQETWRGDAILACIFAPLGCLTRFYISIWLNPLLPSFPLGTFTVNIFGSILEAIFYDLQHAQISGGIGGGLIGCQVLQGLMDGYCGSATTISTWVVELKGLRRRHGYVYGGVSMFVGLACMIVIMGSLQWSKGFRETVCGK